MTTPCPKSAWEAFPSLEASPGARKKGDRFSLEPGRRDNFFWRGWRGGVGSGADSFQVERIVDELEGKPHMPPILIGNLGRLGARSSGPGKGKG